MVQARKLGFVVHLLIFLFVRGSALAGNEIRLPLPCVDAPVDVILDEHAIPHVYAKSIEDAYRAIGYLQAKDRLLQMELFRRTAQGRMAELQGDEAFEQDLLTRQLDLRGSSEQAIKTGILGEEVNRQLEAFAQGVNARLEELKTEEGKKSLPPMIRLLGLTIAPWSPVDSVSLSKYMAWDQQGTDSDLWFGMMVEKLGVDAAEELWPLDRPYELPIVPDWPNKKTPLPNRPTASLKSDAEVLLALNQGKPFSTDYMDLFHHLESGGLMRIGTAFGSNNWVISGSKSATGKPILCNDPHLPLTIPSIWYAAHIVAPGLNVTGVTFPGSPYVVIGHSECAAWGMTNMEADAVDYYIETVNPDNPKQYKHKGQWKEFSERREIIAVRGQSPREITVRATVHGPVVRSGEKSGGKTITLCWAGLGPTAEVRSVAMLGTCKNLDDATKARHYLQVPALNTIYADVDGNIAITPHGSLPMRARGTGRIPMDGASGDYDWLGYIPDEELPISVNPARGFLLSANARPHPVGYPHYLGWMWCYSYRTRRIYDMLSSKEKISFEDMERFQFDAHDKCAERFIPVLVAAFDHAPYGDAVAKKAMDLLRDWDFVCDPVKPQPTIYMEWFSAYRHAVWDDEWKSRGIEQPAGGWGYDEDNRREPMLDVLEYLTLEKPESAWFDDKTTPEHEARDDIFRLSFTAAIEKLKKERGDDPAKWLWGAVNRLALRPLNLNQTPRGGMEILGSPFTVNPGGRGGPVADGASWRQIVELGNPAHAVGVYPGGQSENLSSPHYDDMVDLWVKGKYVPLYFYSAPGEFPVVEANERINFTPSKP